MAGTVVLHVGLMKTGTTFTQNLLFDHQQVLARRGVLVPGGQWSDQVRAVSGVLGDHTGMADWTSLVEPCRTWPGTSVISMEFLGPARRRAVGRVVRSLRPARVEVVVTVRDLNRTLVALWQETVQNGRHWTFEDYLAGVRAARPDLRPEPGTAPAIEPGNDAGRTFWRQQHVVDVCRRWSRRADSCTLVTVPPPGAPRATLQQRMAEAMGVELTDLEPPRKGNESIGAPSVEVLRRLNQLLEAEDLAFPFASRLRKGVLAKQVLGARRDLEPRVGLPVADWVTQVSDWLREQLGSMDLRVVGDLADLAPVPVAGVQPGEVGDAETLEAALAGLAGLVRHRPRSRTDADD